MSLFLKCCFNSFIKSKETEPLKSEVGGLPLKARPNKTILFFFL